jgi:hypothetical protein
MLHFMLLLACALLTQLEPFVQASRTAMTRCCRHGSTHTLTRSATG